MCNERVWYKHAQRKFLLLLLHFSEEYFAFFTYVHISGQLEAIYEFKEMIKGSGNGDIPHIHRVEYYSAIRKN